MVKRTYTYMEGSCSSLSVYAGVGLDVRTSDVRGEALEVELHLL